MLKNVLFKPLSGRLYWDFIEHFFLPIILVLSLLSYMPASQVTVLTIFAKLFALEDRSYQGHSTAEGGRTSKML